MTGKPTPNPAAPDDQPTEPAWHGALGELERLQAEIDDDLTAGRMTPEAYQDASARLAVALKTVTEPLPPGEKIRVVGIPRKEIDTEKLAMVYWTQAKRLAKERREKEARGGQNAGSK